MTKRDLLVWTASFFMLLMLIALVGYLTFIPVPDTNKDLIITVLGVILGGGAAAMPNLFGDKDGETNKLRDSIIQMEKEMAKQKAEHDLKIAELQVQNETLRQQYDKIVAMLVERHVIHGEGLGA